jgi:hypothetical protein
VQVSRGKLGALVGYRVCVWETFASEQLIIISYIQRFTVLEYIEKYPGLLMGKKHRNIPIREEGGELQTRLRGLC